MLRTIRAFLRLLTIARVLARHDALAVLEHAQIYPPLVQAARVVFRKRGTGRPGQKLARALTDLGPSFIKLGQFVSTRADLIGETMAEDLSELHDHLPPFDSATAKAIIAEELGDSTDALFARFDEVPASAASIAQVHMAETSDGEAVAVKVLRPGIEQAFERDLELFYWLAELAERTQPRLRRLKPVAMVRLFEEQVKMEMNLSMEAAAADELAENFADDPTYNVPKVYWERTSRRVFTAGRIQGIPIDDREALIAAGLNLDLVLEKAAAVFFKQVFRDGFFHGDQHPGNMFIDSNGNIIAVDFGIMGRLDRTTRYFLADMLLALLARDYRRLAEVHLEAGYIPKPSAEGEVASLDVFAQALRSVCEPVFGKPLHEISFARVLGQLFTLSEAFRMEVQPQLLLLQKNMMMAEGVSRTLNPQLNTWILAEPLIAEWMRENRGPEARLRDTAVAIGEVARRLPGTLQHLETIVEDMQQHGLRLHPDTARGFGGGGNAWLRLAVVLSAGAFALAGAAAVVAVL